jgi:hypothetical protein
VVNAGDERPLQARDIADHLSEAFDRWDFVQSAKGETFSTSHTDTADQLHHEHVSPHVPTPLGERRSTVSRAATPGHIQGTLLDYEARLEPRTH